ncbi:MULTISPECIES: hypothetical protein [unclassified Psychrobacter]|uniref:hypothetical protein n=1 Tax=unclassified Psychrobacter TaxID=196806 RepID=UPI0018F35FB1|nr:MULTISPECIES: hypothetical protein [unclassified Psychrobacter]
MLPFVSKNKYAAFIALLATLVAVPASAANQQYDWTPFFKSWENACELEPQEVMFTSMLPDSETLALGSIVVPKKYALAVDSALTTTFYDMDGNLSSKGDANYFDTRFDVVGSYYGIPMASIGFVGGVGNGIYMPYFVLNANITDVRKTLRQKNIVINYESSEFHDSDMYGNSDIGMEIQVNDKDPTRTDIICNFSN